ncbi:MAG: hypothetical protein HKN25_14700 [Pyrinomonadaceae bacterium]|nr:hypothetical protein [Pyrinomonadaceae bacterium]
MKLVLLIMTVLLSLTCVFSQESQPDPNPAKNETLEANDRTPAASVEEDPSPVFSSAENIAEEKSPGTNLNKKLAELKPESVPAAKFSPLKPKKIDILEEVKSKSFSGKSLKPQTNAGDKFHWKTAIVESLYFLGVQQSLRMLQKKTRREIKGPFFRDWGRSVKNLGKWRDGDSVFTNYVAHPMQGAVTGRIFINNSERSRRQEFGRSKEYWKSRAKAMAWSAAWSTQFELGPISEASIGNVGLYDRVGPNRMGWVDLVITPTAGTLVLIGEDVIDKYILKGWLEKRRSRRSVRLLRTFITPFQSFTNFFHGKHPWKRYTRH